MEEDFLFFQMEASVKAAKFHSCVVGHLIDCKLTVIERDCILLLRRDMALRSLARTSHRCFSCAGIWPARLCPARL